MESKSSIWKSVYYKSTSRSTVDPNEDIWYDVFTLTQLGRYKMVNDVVGTYSYKTWIARLKELGLTCEEQINPVLTVQRGQKWDRNELGTGTSYAIVSVHEERVLYAKKAGKFVAVYRDIDSGWIDPSIDTDDKS